MNLAALDWIETRLQKLRRGVVLAANYGFSRPEYYAANRRTGTLQCYADHRVLPSLLEQVGKSDLTTHVEWTSVAERAEKCGLRLAGFTDQHHFLTGLLSSHPELASAGAEKSRALQTLIHPEFLGVKFQFLGLEKGFPGSCFVRRIRVCERQPPRAGAGFVASAVPADETRRSLVRRRPETAHYRTCAATYSSAPESFLESLGTLVVRLSNGSQCGWRVFRPRGRLP